MEFDLDKSILILKRTPGVLRALVGDLPQEWTHRDYGPQTWTAHQSSDTSFGVIARIGCREPSTFWRLEMTSRLNRSIATGT